MRYLPSIGRGTILSQSGFNLWLEYTLCEDCRAADMKRSAELTGGVSRICGRILKMEVSIL